MIIVGLIKTAIIILIIISMLFHNRPVKAAMGSVIVNGGMQLIGGKSLVKSKLATLHFGVKMSLLY